MGFRGGNLWQYPSLDHHRACTAKEHLIIRNCSLVASHRQREKSRLMPAAVPRVCIPWLPGPAKALLTHSADSSFREGRSMAPTTISDYSRTASCLVVGAGVVTIFVHLRKVCYIRIAVAIIMEIASKSYRKTVDLYFTTVVNSLPCHEGHAVWSTIYLESIPSMPVS